MKEGDGTDFKRTTQVRSPSPRPAECDQGPIVPYVAGHYPH